MKAATTLLVTSYFAYLGRVCGDSGIGTTYKEPFRPTKCHGNDGNQFPAGYLFAAAGPRIWDNGAACDRVYEVRCKSTYLGGTGLCIDGSVQVKIVDGKLGRDAVDIALTETARSKIYTGRGRFNIEFRQIG